MILQSGGQYLRSGCAGLILQDHDRQSLTEIATIGVVTSCADTRRWLPRSFPFPGTRRQQNCLSDQSAGIVAEIDNVSAGSNRHPFLRIAASDLRSNFSVFGPKKAMRI